MATEKTTEVTGEVKVKKTRKPSEPKPVFVVFNVLDENGVAMPFDNKRINLITATESGGEALEAMDGGKHPYATYKSVMVKKGR